jgi:hypothetical protein
MSDDNTASSAPKRRHALNGEIIKVHKGIAIYKTHASPFYFARIRDPRARKYVVRSTKETSRIRARTAAEELAETILNREKAVPKEYSFTYYANRFLARGTRLVETGERNANYVRTARVVVNNDAWGLVRHFGAMDVRDLKTRHWAEFLNALAKKRPDLSGSTRNMLSATFRNILKEARSDGVIDELPDTPRTKQRDNPRPFFRFHPLVDRERDTYQTLLTAAKDAAGTTLRGVTVSDELYDLILFVTDVLPRMYPLRRRVLPVDG